MKTGKRLTVLITVLLLLFSASSSAFEVVKSSYLQIIAVAFMNGFVKAVQMDEADFHRLKTDQEYLKKTVETAKEEYLQKVRQINGQ